MKRTILVPALLALACACASVTESSRVGSGHADEAKAGFERIKALAGEWSGTGSSEMPTVDVRYRVTGNGSAVEETLFPGTPHEMVTMYHLDGDRLMLTHYCAAGNQPTMIAVPTGAMHGDGATIRFEFSGATNMASKNDGHMHQAELTFEGKDHLISKWTHWQDNKPGHEARFELTRKTAG